MATQLRNQDPMASVIAVAHNDLKAQIGAGSAFHLDKGTAEYAVSAPNAADLATSLVLVNQLRTILLGGGGILASHFADTLAHKVVDTADAATIAAPAATDLTTANTLANQIKSAYNTHIASTTYHYNADATNTISSANATDQSSLNTLLNELKTDFNAHIASGPASASLRLIPA